MSSDPPPYSSFDSNEKVDDLGDGVQGLNIKGKARALGVHKIVVGVDFGTTYTGVSWVSSEDAASKTLDDVHCIRDWPGPGRDADYSWKTPSRIAYGSENGSTDTQWGYEVLPRMKSYSWMKLLLDPEQATLYDDPGLATSEGRGVLTKPSNKSAVDLCADYLAKVCEFAHQSLTKRISAETLAATPLEFWFTVPAVWSDKAKADTQLAAKKAAQAASVSFHADTQLYLIPEPEAAAIATISSLTKGGSQQFVKPGDGIIICDCGGGTVDVTTYEIVETKPQLSFKELVVGIGGKCGSTYIDREFIKWMSKKFGKAYDNLAWEKKGPASRIMKEFEGHKRDFGKTKAAGKYYEMQLLMRDAKESKYYDEDSGIVKIYEEDMLQLFKPVVTKVTQLLQNQLDAAKKQKSQTTIKTVILVGGFGDSAYLNEYVRAWCKKSKIRLLCPEHPQAAIVKGAALSGLQNIRPTMRRSRRHYGFGIHQPYDPLKHKKEDLFIWEWNGTQRAKNQVEWRLGKGDIVDESTRIEQLIVRTKYDDEEDELSSMTIYVCDEDEAPEHQKAPGVRRLATMYLDHRNVDKSVFRSKIKEDKRRITLIDEEFYIYFGQKRGVLCFEGESNGVEIGTTTVAFDSMSAEDGSSGAAGSASGVGVGVEDVGCAMQ